MDFDEAEAAAGSIKPAWDAGDSDAAADGFTPSWGAEGDDGATTAVVDVNAEAQTVSVEVPPGVLVPSPSIVIRPVISIGAPTPDSKPEPAPPAHVTVPVGSLAPVSGATVLGMSPAAQAIVAAENARLAGSIDVTQRMAPFASAASTAPVSASPQSTRLGGISPEAAAIVAAANEAFRAPLPTMQLDSSSFIETAKSVPSAKAPSFKPPPPFAPIVSAVPDKTPSTAPTKAASKFPSAASAQAAPFAVKDPFKSPSLPPAEAFYDDLPMKKKASPVLFVAIGAVALIGIGVVAKLAIGGGDDATKPVPSTLTHSTPAPPTNDIPPPPPVDEVTPPSGTTTAAAKTTEPAKVPEPASHAAKAPTYVAHPAAAPPPAAKPAGAPPKSPPKTPGGGIVRDSPF